jgi:hypothetical protein
MVLEDISMQRQGKFTKVNGATISGMGRGNTLWLPKMS